MTCENCERGTQEGAARETDPAVGARLNMPTASCRNIVDQAVAHMNTPGTDRDTREWVLECAVLDAYAEGFRAGIERAAQQFPHGCVYKSGTIHRRIRALAKEGQP